MMAKEKIENGSKVAVIGGGPAGSFSSIFLIDLAKRAGLDIDVDIFEPQDYMAPGPKGCNMCAGIISESLIQNLATEGINLPSTVVQRGIDSYIIHTPDGDTSIRTAMDERRIATVYRGAGPKDIKESDWRSFDGHLLSLAIDRGASHKQEKVTGITRQNGKLEVYGKDDRSNDYDLAVIAGGLSPNNMKIIENLDLNYKPPKKTKSHIREFYFGEDAVKKYLGSNIHVFLLNIPELEFAALVPKGDYVTLCLIGVNIDNDLVESLLSMPQIKKCLPDDIDASGSCRCSPYIYLEAAAEPYGDQIVFVGDSSTSRLFKDGIGAAYRTSKAAATTAVLQGTSARDFERHYFRACQKMERDNRIGRFVFWMNGQIQRRSWALGGFRRMIDREQLRRDKPQRMSGVTWDTFTGSAPYTDIFKRSLHPFFISRFVSDIASEILGIKQKNNVKEENVKTGTLGSVYQNGEIIISEGEAEDNMYVIQQGQVEILKDGVKLSTLKEGEFFGEMALFEKERRTATVRALGDVRVLTIDKKTLLRRVQEDPSLAFRIIEKLSGRVRELNSQVTELKSVGADNYTDL